MNKTRIIVLGANGMIGSTIFKVLADDLTLSVFGTVRSKGASELFPDYLRSKLILFSNFLDISELDKFFDLVSPDIVINCIGLTKHRPESISEELFFNLNSKLPKILAQLSSKNNSKLIQISTDCVFSGAKGNYLEGDLPDAIDPYGLSKAEGEIIHPNVLVLRTSTIGKELNTKYGLLEWFLSQKSQCYGFSKAFFSGLTTQKFAEVIRDYVIKNDSLNGIYNVGGPKISKLNLLKLLSNEYEKNIKIIPTNDLAIDRSLDSTQFQIQTGYVMSDWISMIKEMKSKGNFHKG